MRTFGAGPKPVSYNRQTSCSRLERIPLPAAAISSQQRGDPMVGIIADHDLDRSQNLVSFSMSLGPSILKVLRNPLTTLLVARCYFVLTACLLGLVRHCLLRRLSDACTSTLYTVYVHVKTSNTWRSRTQREDRCRCSSLRLETRRHTA